MRSLARLLVALATVSLGAGFLAAAGPAGRGVPTAACEALGPLPSGPAVGAGDEAPDFELADATGARRRLCDYRGRPVLLHFWATFCPPCVEEMPAIEALARRLGARATVLAVSVDEGWDDLKRFFPRGTSLPLLLDHGKVVARRYGSRGFPESFLIDARGRVRHFFHQARWDTPAGLACIATLP